MTVCCLLLLPQTNGKGSKRRCLTCGISWAQLGSNQRPLACKARIPRRSLQVPGPTCVLEVQKLSLSLPGSAWRSVHDGSRYWFPDQCQDRDGSGGRCRDRAYLAGGLGTWQMHLPPSCTRLLGSPVGTLCKHNRSAGNEVPENAGRAESSVRMVARVSAIGMGAILQAPRPATGDLCGLVGVPMPVMCAGVLVERICRRSGIVLRLTRTLGQLRRLCVLSMRTPSTLSWAARWSWILTASWSTASASS
jgi:hypothetical protein